MPKADQGINRDRYMVIPRTLVFLQRGDEVLLIKGAPTKRLWANQYNGIGGHVEQGEDILSAARRELLEESGLQARNLRLVGTMIVDASEGIGVCIFIYKADYLNGDLLASEEGELTWIPLSRLEEYPIVTDLRVLLRRIFDSEPEGQPFSAYSYYNQEDQQVVDFRN